MSSDLIQKTYFKLLNYLAHTARTEHELRQRIRLYLRKEDISREEKTNIEDALVSDLKELNLLNDANYVNQVISQKLASQKPESKFSIVQFLLRRGINKSDIGDKLSSYTPELEREKVLQMAMRKLSTYKGADLRIKKQKIMKYLQSKHFSLDTIRSVVDSINELK